MNDTAQQISALKTRLITLDRERAEVAERLAALEQRHASRSAAKSANSVVGVTMESPTAAKLALFQSLFRGREDVFPRRWQNPKTGKTG